MAISNFWVYGDCDGRKTPLSFGPKPGYYNGFTLTIHIKNNGGSFGALKISGRVLRDGTLLLEADDCHGNTLGIKSFTYPNLPMSFSGRMRRWVLALGNLLDYVNQEPGSAKVPAVMEARELLEQ